MSQYNKEPNFQSTNITSVFNSNNFANSKASSNFFLCKIRWRRVSGSVSVRHRKRMVETLLEFLQQKIELLIFYTRKRLPELTKCAQALNCTWAHGHVSTLMFAFFRCWILWLRFAFNQSTRSMHLFENLKNVYITSFS